ncbi:sacsin N-terminal ATP-binding-like domain-containing protein [Flavobacterium sp. XS2P39]|uniref:sacsin N-terminal ATP-binding-like domain-containing protein n=1 Tax=Flavobacterium sp. XS2P39 TaxID=3401725 RepID=UPI003AB0B569
MSDTPQKSAVDIALDEDRKKSEIKAILQDLERLKTVPVERKRRWIWELLQNAKDCASKHGTKQERTVNVEISLNKSILNFSHDGIPFTLNDLLALVRRTSTKAFDHSDDSTGKFGTGFVTTHALNRMATVSGILQARNGPKEFIIPVDRRADSFNELEISLNEVFGIINTFYEEIGNNIGNKTPTIYSYKLDDDSYHLALKSIGDFIKNLPFALLINSTDEKSGIGTITVTFDQQTTIYSLSPPTEIFPGVMFSELNGKIKTNNEKHQEGLIHFSYKDLTIAVPAIYKNNLWEVQKIEKEIKLFRDFPLVGTETWHIPFLLQSANFQPSEQRDGVRTFKDNEDRVDPTADTNRNIFISYKTALISFFTILQSAGVKGLHLLTESGLPEEKIEYTSTHWYTSSIQKPLREFFSKHPLITTASGKPIAISQAKIPRIFPVETDNLEFYQIAVKLFQDQFPDENTFLDWQRIVSQDSENWETTITCTEEDLLKCVIAPNGLDRLELTQDEAKINWLNQLINFLHRIGRHDLIEGYAIYPNTKGDLLKKEALRKDNLLSDKLKEVGDKLGQKIYDVLIHPDIELLDGIDVFDIKAFYYGINTFIGGIIPANEHLEKFQAIFELVSMFPNDLSRERNKWFNHISQLVPELIPEKQQVKDMEDFNFGSAELASIKYVCWLVENSLNFNEFSNTYFKNDKNSAYKWLNTMIEILFRTTDYQTLLATNAIIPMQSGMFRKLEANIFREDKKDFFDPLLKELYTTYTGNGDAKNILIAIEITIEMLPWATAELLAKPIDDLFLTPDIQKNVESGKPLNPLFHSLNNWFGDDETERGILFPHFRKERPVLYVKAFGPEISKMVMALSKIDKTPEEIQALAELDMSASELNILIEASKMAGGAQKLLIAANEMQEAARQAEWRKAVGNAAEDAFVAAIENIKALNITKPDNGYDFEIIHQGNDPYLLEIKSTVEHNETVKMSGTQGRTAKKHKERYALCVLLREQYDTVVDKEYFIANARFILKIGNIIEPKVDDMENSLAKIGSYNTGEIQTRLENNNYTVNVSRAMWRNFLSFDEFIRFLEYEYFKIVKEDNT